MKSDIDEVALQGIEFWSNVCDEEMDLAIEASEVSLGRTLVWGNHDWALGHTPLWILLFSGKALFCLDLEGIFICSDFDSQALVMDQ